MALPGVGQGAHQTALPAALDGVEEPKVKLPFYKNPTVQKVALIALCVIGALGAIAAIVALAYFFPEVMAVVGLVALGVTVVGLLFMSLFAFGSGDSGGLASIWGSHGGGYSGGYRSSGGGLLSSSWLH